MSDPQWYSVTAIGQDSHRFVALNETKKLVLGGVVLEGERALEGNSDADVILHAVTNAVSGVTGVNILGTVADTLCLKEGITDSRVYLAKALQHLGQIKLIHLSITVECKTPKLSPHIEKIKESLEVLCGLPRGTVGVTATTGEGLTDFGRGEGIQVFAVLTALKQMALR